MAWTPQTGPQTTAIEAARDVDELFYGGAAGGGKTDYLLGDFLQDVGQGACWQGILFRRTYPELDEIVQRSLEIYPLVGGEYRASTPPEWRFPGGAVLRLRSLDSDLEFPRYQGHTYSWIGWDELPNWASMAARMSGGLAKIGSVTSTRTGGAGRRLAARIRADQSRAWRGRLWPGTWMDAWSICPLYCNPMRLWLSSPRVMPKALR